MRRSAFIAMLVLSLLPGVAAAEGGFSGFFRSLTGLLGSGDDDRARRMPATATIGIRGMDEGGVTDGAPAEADLKLLDGWAANKVEAKAAAKRRGVVARDVALGSN